jgi:hypothetical protein
MNDIINNNMNKVRRTVSLRYVFAVIVLALLSLVLFFGF